METMCKAKCRQKGLTLVELIIALAIASIIMAALSGAVYQVLAGSARSTNNMAAMRQVQQVGHEISRDALQARPAEIMISDNPEEPILTIVWREVYAFNEDGREDKLHKSEYFIENGVLTRQYYDKIEDEEDEAEYEYLSSKMVAQSIILLECSLNGSTLVITVTAQVGGWQTGIAERTYEIKTRPD